jgi:hypothetical protein
MEFVLEAKIALKITFFYFLQTICFWNPEMERRMNLLEFLRLEVIRGHKRSLEVILTLNKTLDMYIFF